MSDILTGCLTQFLEILSHLKTQLIGAVRSVPPKDFYHKYKTIDYDYENDILHFVNTFNNNQAELLIHSIITKQNCQLHNIYEREKQI